MPYLILYTKKEKQKPRFKRQDNIKNFTDPQ